MNGYSYGKNFPICMAALQRDLKIPMSKKDSQAMIGCVTNL